MTGTEAMKNAQAAAKLQEILDATVWVNLHSMLDAGGGRGGGSSSDGDGDDGAGQGRSSSSSSSVCVLEIRVASGHGARWSWRDPGRWTRPHMQFMYAQQQQGHEQQGHEQQGQQQRGQQQGEEGEEEERSTTAGALCRAPEISFRGFVEPLILDGHEKKWRH